MVSTASQSVTARTVLALHAYIGTLHAQLRSAGVASEDIDPIPSPSETEDPHAPDIGSER